MGVLFYTHPDIGEFISSKKGGGLRNFNISVGLDAAFFDALRTGKEIPLVNPRDGSVWREIGARDLWKEIAGGAWATGDPGVLFIDEINRLSTLPGMGPIEATNPCGEQPLLPYESCNLGSINLSGCVRRRDLDEGMLSELARTGVDFLNAIIDVNRFPIPEIQEMNAATRKIGLGIMGFADALIKLGIPYESGEALRFAEGVMSLVQKAGHERSAELGGELGSFPAIGKSTYTGAMRNSTVTTIAPTGSLHILAGTSSGIEPLFALALERQMAGRTVPMVNQLFIQAVSRLPRSADLIHRALVEGAARNLPIPDARRQRCVKDREPAGGGDAGGHIPDLRARPFLRMQGDHRVPVQQQTRPGPFPGLRGLQGGLGNRNKSCQEINKENLNINGNEWWDMSDLRAS
jgi:ribonucleoside-diphosphate reductase alpha chain